MRKGLDWDELHDNVRRMISCATRCAARPRSLPPRSISRVSTSPRSSASGCEGIGVDYLIKRKYLTWGDNTTLDRPSSADPARLSQHRRGALSLHLRAAQHRQPRQRHGLRLRHLRQHQHGQCEHASRFGDIWHGQASGSIATSIWPATAKTSRCAPVARTGNIAPGITTTGRSCATPRRAVSASSGCWASTTTFRAWQKITPQA